jgi:hypothetical protein
MIGITKAWVGLLLIEKARSERAHRIAGLNSVSCSKQRKVHRVYLTIQAGITALISTQLLKMKMSTAI